MLGLYIHIPFCQRICPYCDFYKMVASTNLKKRYLNAILEEAKLKKLNNFEINTIYFGGGTPSCIDVELLDNFLLQLFSYINMNNVSEITFECNPEDVSEKLVKVLSKYKINRISLGIQSFNMNIQHLINRKYSVSQIENIIALLNKYNIYNISADFMYGYINTSLDDIKRDLDAFLSLKIKHISTYALTIEEHSIFGYQSTKNINFAASDEIQAEQYYYIIDYLKKFNFYQYEISNFSKPGYKSMHNLIYWNDDDYLALGSGATAFYNHIRYVTTKKIYDYLAYLEKQELPPVEEEKLSDEELQDEYVIMNLRKNDGIDLDKFKEKFNLQFEKTYPSYINLIKEKLLVLDDNKLYIAEDYKFISNYIIVKLLS